MPPTPDARNRTPARWRNGSSAASTPSSARSPRAAAGRSACWPAPAPARPGRSPTASRTGCTRASTARSACSRSPSPPGPPARCAAGCAASASAGSRPAPSTPPRCASCSTSGRRRRRRPCPSCWTARRSWSPRPRAGCRLGVGPRRLRDLAAEIEWAKVSHARPRTDYPADAAGPAGRCPAARPADGRRGSTRPTRRSSATAASSTSRTCCCSPSACSRTQPGRRRDASGRSTATSSSTSTRTSARCSSGCWSCGSAAATSSASWATPARRSTPSPAPPRTTCSASAAGIPGATVVRLVRDYRSTPQVVRLANGLLGRRRRARRARAGLELVAQRRPGPRAEVHRVPRRARPRPTAVAARVARAARRRGCRRSEIAVLFRINAQSEAYEQALGRGRACRTSARRRAVLRAGGGPRGRRCCCAARPGRRPRRGTPAPLAEQVRDVLAGAGWTAGAAGRRRRGA